MTGMNQWARPVVPENRPATLALPAPTAWPLCAAFGVALVFTGLVTSASVSVLGALAAITGYVGWFREVLPREKHVTVRVAPKEAPIVTRRLGVTRAQPITHALHRARLPLEIYPVSAGVKGGLAGSVVMAGLAAIYGLISGHGVWYPINLLAAGFFPGLETTAELDAFHADALIIASIVHLATSLLVGLLYGAMLPMLPRRPVLLGGAIAPLLWTGLLYSVLEFINPVLNRRIDWPWFLVSQIGFGVVAGLVVSKQNRVRTWQHLPFAVRAGIEVPRAEETSDKKPR
jgi:hypothetical protein